MVQPWPHVRLLPAVRLNGPAAADSAGCAQVAQQLRLSPGGEAHVRALSPPFARALLGLMSACCDRITSQPAWETLLSLLENTSSHPDAVLPAGAALDALCRGGRGVCTANFMHVVTAVRTLATNACGLLTAAAHARTSGREVDMPFGVDEVRDMVNLLELMAGWLQTWRQRQAQVRVPPERETTTHAAANSRGQLRLPLFCRTTLPVSRAFANPRFAVWHAHDHVGHIACSASLSPTVPPGAPPGTGSSENSMAHRHTPSLSFDSPGMYCCTQPNTWSGSCCCLCECW